MKKQILTIVAIFSCITFSINLAAVAEMPGSLTREKVIKNLAIALLPRPEIRHNLDELLSQMNITELPSVLGSVASFTDNKGRIILVKIDDFRNPDIESID